MGEKQNNMTIRMDDEQLRRVDEALNFYISYVASKDATGLLAPAITTVIEARLRRFEKSIAENLYRVAVEQDMVSGLLANVYQLDEEYLLQLRSEAVRAVKKTNGQLSLEQHVWSRNEDDEWQD